MTFCGNLGDLGSLFEDKIGISFSKNGIVFIKPGQKKRLGEENHKTFDNFIGV